jgi:outer membrane protein OmpA-like peptidoglycan-associated protein
MQIKKYLVAILTSLFLFLLVVNLEAQIKVDVKKKVNREANQRANQKTDQAVDKTFDKVEEGIGGLFKKKKKTEKEEEADQEGNTTDEQATEGEEESSSRKKQKKAKRGDQESESGEGEPQEQKKSSVLVWAKYDFVPGSEVIFEDDLKNEQNGEFPSKWDLKAGTVEVANVDGENVIWFRKSSSQIYPLIKVKDYLPDEFTLEFDYNMANQTQHHYTVYFQQRGGNRSKYRLDIGGRGLELFRNETNSHINGDINKEFEPGWRHLAISFNKRSMKVYVDDQRVLNIPNLEEEVGSFLIHSGLGTSKDEAKSIIKNIKVAKGAVPLYDRVLSDGKFVTTGIKFDVNSSNIKPESAGTLNYVYEMLKSNPDLKFCVEGHTDSDGNDANNQTLSEARSKAIKDRLVSMGIASDRLTSKGWGESKPLASNDTPEGKAQNRRVEFVKTN